MLLDKVTVFKWVWMTWLILNTIIIILEIRGDFSVLSKVLSSVLFAFSSIPVVLIVLAKLSPHLFSDLLVLLTPPDASCGLAVFGVIGIFCQVSVFVLALHLVILWSLFSLDMVEKSAFVLMTASGLIGISLNSFAILYD